MKPYGFNFDTTYTALPQQFFTSLQPDTVTDPAIVMVNEPLAASMELDFSSLPISKQAALFSGNQLPETATPFAQAYAGHQFGHFAILGDGRAHLWGEHITSAGERFDIQFKGSGRTPYSRRGDGKAALGPMLREYIISEAMYHLGIPTTRSLAVVTTGENVMRKTSVPGAILTRVASSHLRVGTFEFAVHHGGKEALQALLHYSIARHHSDIVETSNTALAFLKAVMEKQANLIVQWMRVGFIHGVMNTDNMAISGETIDYGPCAFMDHYDPNAVFSSIDSTGRYAYANQPKIAPWNLARLAETLLPLIHDNTDSAIALAEETILQFPDLYHKKWLAMMRNKLGLLGVEKEDELLITDLLDWMQTHHADYTTLFHELSQPHKPRGRLYENPEFKAWYSKWQTRRQQGATSSTAWVELMQRTNPAIIPRNHKVEQALEAANNADFQPFKALLAAVERPYQDREQLKNYQNPPEPHERVYQTFCGT